MDGAGIKKLRQRHNWSQLDLAEAINGALGRTYGSSPVSAWENNKRPLPADVSAFLDSLAVATVLPPDDNSGVPPGSPHDGSDVPAADIPPGPGPTPIAQPAFGDATSWTKACTELWELVASGVGMIGAATSSKVLVRDGAIIDADKEALGKAWGKLAETNETFRKMLIGMTEGGAWLTVAMVTGTTVSKCWQNHAQYELVEQPEGYRDDDGLAAHPVAA